ncbi:hypothetical protein BU17DRAFT_100594 [Hysterangium stoloniferum]|nr:hypothetical protein BU17DRAFT_100594 [Hysterangium stoloniferum]
MSTVKIKVLKQAAEQPIKSFSRKSVKRRITSDDEDSDVDLSPTPSSSTAKHSAKRPRTTTADLESDEDIPSPPARSSKHNPLKSRGRIGGTKGVVKRNRRILSDDEDEEFVPAPEEKSATVVAKAKKKDVKGKSGANSGAGQIIAKNESKPSATQRALSGTVADGKKPSRKEGEIEMDVDLESHVPQPPVPALPLVDAGPPKKKLPTIKKKPKVGTAANSSVAPPGAGAVSRPEGSVLKPGTATGTTTATSLRSSAVPATTLNPSGTGDFDLRDSSTWQSLIGKGTSSSGPRVGVEKRVSTEERRKQLDKLRDEARAQRVDQFRQTFDLQAQSLKINRFEVRSSVPGLLQYRSLSAFTEEILYSFSKDGWAKHFGGSVPS